jgi:hypothetical protein
MAELLYLSYWLRGVTEHNMLRHFEKLLRTFPFSTQSPKPVILRIYAIEYAEPPMLERSFDPLADPGALIQSAKEFAHSDCAYVVQGYWDIWRYEQDWKLTPSQVTLACHGPLFENEQRDQLRAEVGLDSDFLPQPEVPDSVKKVQSNIKGLLRLAHELDNSLPSEKRLLWSESGRNFAEKLQSALG